MGKAQRIGLFGGSFDPVHNGHLLMAMAACEELELTRLFFIPAAQSPLKPDTRPAPDSERLRMLRLALAGCPQYAVDDQEIQRGGTSFTLETVRDYHRRFPAAELFYLIGADHVALLPKWRGPGELARLARFVVVPRPGEDPAPLPAPFQGGVLQGFPLGVSSSQVRSRVQAGKSIRGLVPDAVAEAIERSQLYR
jgi:nicotinate-nucleotide adenylyltransferase